MGMHATKDRVESDTSTVYSISLYGSTITTRDEPCFGELKLALGVIGLPVTVRDRILRGESGASRSTVERKIFGPSSFSTGFQTFLQHRTWILYEPMDRDKSLLLAMTSSFITSFFPYPSPLFSVEVASSQTCLFHRASQCPDRYGSRAQEGILAGKRALSNRYESLYKALSFPNSCVAAEMAVVRRLAGPNRIMKTRLVAAYSLTKESCIAVYLYAKYAKAVKRLYRKED
ncbi:hypothetical protein L1987_89625 [Smallanthus sonchifolius]|nr:hypothetical protein L1987_89625 [Smallanthus sonchifolius]